MLVFEFVWLVLMGDLGVGVDLGTNVFPSFICLCAEESSL